MCRIVKVVILHSQSGCGQQQLFFFSPRTYETRHDDMLDDGLIESEKKKKKKKKNVHGRREKYVQV